MRFIDFFAGVGGFRKGMEMAGHECVGFCEFDKYAVASYTSMHLITNEQREDLGKIDIRKRQKEILKEEYRNGEWYANDIRTVDARKLPKADCWCFGFPCQDISVAGKQLGFNGHRSSLFFAVTKLIRELKEEDRPKYLFIENVKNLLSVNGGFDFAKLLVELDEIGYDAEWQVLNSKDFGVPQNRERCFIVGHLRTGCGPEVFPIERTNGEGDFSINLIANVNPSKKGLNGNVYYYDGINPTLTTNKGDGNKIGFPVRYGSKNAIKGELSESLALLSSDYKGITGRNQDNNAVCIPVLTPDRTTKRQNGRRFKENGDPSFALTSQDRNGVVVNVKEATKSGYAECVYAIWSEKYQCYIAVRKLTPKECFRLQGWPDDYFEKAEFVNFDSQLYKQAGNGVTVPVIYQIARKMEA